MLNVLDLFSGIGGFSLGLERSGGFKTIAFCEKEEYCQKVLNKHWPDVPIFDHINNLSGSDIHEPIDVICGGYPCQPFSLAGNRRGADDDRHLWPEMLRLIQEFRPSWVICENVYGHISMGLDQVLSDLESENYSSQSFVIPAAGVDAPHRRNRVWIIAHANPSNSGQGSRDQSEGEEFSRLCKRILANTSSEQCKSGSKYSQRKTRCNSGGCCESTSVMGDSIGEGSQIGEIFGRGQSEKKKSSSRKIFERASRWPAEPGICRVVNGLPNRVDRLRALGNSVVPQIPEIFGNIILEIEAQR